MFKNKEGKVRSGWKIAAVLGVFFAVLFILSAIAGIITTLIILSNGNFNSNPMENIEIEPYVNDLLMPILMIIQELVLMFTPIIAWKYVIKRPLSNMGLTPFKKHSKEFVTGLLFGIVSITLVFAALLLTDNAVVATWKPHFSSDTIIYLVIFTLVGFAEEIFGRGYVMATLRQTRNIPAIVLISSILFAIMHGANPGIGLLPLVNLALFGILFSYCFLKSGNIWMGIGYHITWNYFQGNVFGFKVSGTNTTGILTTSYESNNLINGGEFGPEGGLLVTAVLLLGFLFVRYYYRNVSFDFIATEPEAKVQEEL
ncbi:MAG: CPBP family intramembrane metalloprotease [Clostridiales bacterium]|nr:CPBP family intramembrane metalloprotease [Clostridiales bacterium]